MTSKLPETRILLKLLETTTRKKLANAYGVSERTIRRKIKPTNRVKQKAGRKPKITSEARELLLSFTDYGSEDNDLTQEEMAKRLKEKGVFVSRQTVARFLKKNKQTWKRITYKPLEQRWDEIERFRNRTWHLPLTQFSCLDEFPLYLDGIPRYAWAPRGKRAWVLKPNKKSVRLENKSASITLIICLQRTEKRWIIYGEVLVGKVNTKVFYDYLNKLKPSTEKSCLLMDNVPFHRAPNKRKALGLPTIEKQLAEKNMTIDYFPAHSPMLNPAEPIGGLIKHNLGKVRAWTFEKLKETVYKEIAKLNKRDLTSTFRHALTYFDEKIIKSRIEYWERKAPLVYFNGMIVYGSVRVYRLC